MDALWEWKEKKKEKEEEKVRLKLTMIRLLSREFDREGKKEKVRK